MTTLPVAGKKKFTYQDTLKWPDDKRWELIEGVPYAMSAAPGSLHQEISMELSRQLANFFMSKECRVYAAPYDVCLPAEAESCEGATTVVQPDLVVVCDPARRRPRGCLGPPDLVIEILSPASLSHDQVRKLNLYERFGVREYWIVHPEGSVMVFRLNGDGRYGRPLTFDAGAQIPVADFPGLSIDLRLVFRERPEDVVRESPAPYVP